MRFEISWQLPFHPLALGLGLVLGLAAKNIEAANSALVFVSGPTSEVRQDTLIRLIVASRNPVDTLKSGCAIYAGPVAAGSAIAGHPNRLRRVTETEGPNKTRILAFKPNDIDTTQPGSPAQLPLGIHYVVAACPDTGGHVTPELPMRIVTTQAPSILTPHATETNPRPDLSWTAVPGVPAYHLLLSDQALQIDPQGGGVSGASVIWQAIVTGTHITYGTPDPSGNFSQVPAPPLTAGIPYNLVVLNNYDGVSALATSTRSQGLRLFTLTPKGSPPGKPKILAPAKGVTFTAPRDSQIVFRWSASKGGDPVNVYQLYVYAAEDQQGSEVLLPVWQGEFTDTVATLDARRTLLTQRYVTKVFAVTAAGLTAVSDTVSFKYSNLVQTLSLAARGPNGAGDTVFLENVRVTVTPITGSGQPFPIYTIGQQRVEKQLAVGSYSLDFSKDGFITDRRTVTLTVNGVVQATGFLSQAACLVQARVVGENGQPLDNAHARLESENAEVVQANSDAGGRLAIGLKPGRYRLSLSREDYATRPDTLLDLISGETRNLGNLILKRATALLTGTVSSSTGSLPGVQITIRDGAGLLIRKVLTDGSGNFQALLNPGAYRVSATFAGMVGSEQIVTLKQSADMRFLLEAGASIIRGRVRLLVSGSSDPPSPIQGASVDLTHEESGAIRHTTTDVNGEFSLSTAATGDFGLVASYSGSSGRDSVSFSLSDTRATVERDLTLRALMQLQGGIKLTPDTALDASVFSVTLLDNRSDKVVRTGRAYRDTSGLRFLIEGVADGFYRITASGGNYASEVEPTVDVSEGVVTGKLNLALTKIAGTLIFSLRGNDSSLAGTIRIFSPRSLALHSGDTLKPAGFGTYQMAATPNDSARLPLIRTSQVIEKVSGRPTEVVLDCPFTHRQLPEKQKDGRYLFLLQEDIGLDSGYLLVETQTGLRQTISLRGNDAKIVSGVRQILVRPNTDATRLTYWFMVYQGGATYANDDPPRRFHIALLKPGELAEIRVDVSDSMRVPEHSRSTLTVSALDAEGRSLDSSLVANGALKWRHTGSQAFGLPKAQGNKLVLESGAAPTSSSERDGEKTQSDDNTFDTLAITASLGGLDRSVTVYVRIEAAQINSIRLSTSIGDASQIESPRTLGLRILAFDTTYHPPLPLLPNPSFTLDPPEAGRLRGTLLDIDSNFIGPLRIRGHHTYPDGRLLENELNPVDDVLARGLNVGQTLKPGAKKRAFRHGHDLSLIAPDSLVGGDAGTVIRVYSRYLPKTFTSLRDSAIAGGVWEIANPSGAALRGHLTLGLTAPSSLRDRQNTLRRFDAVALAWLPTDTLATEFDGLLRPVVRGTVKGLDGNYWAILSASGELEASDLSIVPNPFSPRVTALRDGNTQPGTRIRFRPDSRESSEITVTLSLFTLEGERVRLLADHQTHPKTTIEYYWDGKTDEGKMARNGRYLLVLTLSPTGGGRTKQFLKSVVVFQ